MSTQDLFRKLYSLAGALLLLECLGQFFLAGLMLFTLAKGGESKEMLWAAEQSSQVFFAIHVFNGTVIVPSTMALLVVFSFAARHPWRTTGLSATLLPLLLVQYLLADQAFAAHQSGSPLLAAFHPLNGLLILGLTLWLLWRHWAFPLPFGRPLPRLA
jgi:hypothetical protein